MPSGAGPGTTRGRSRAASPRGAAAGPPRTPRRGQAMSTRASLRAPLRAVEKPRRPHRTPDRQAGLYRQDRHPAPPRLSAQRGPAACIYGQRRTRQTSPRQVDLLGPALPHPGVRRPGPPRRAPPRRHQRRPRPRPIPRTDRIHQHQDPTADPDCVRIPLPTSTYRPGHARPRRPPPRPARPPLTPTPGHLSRCPFLNVADSAPPARRRPCRSASLRSGAPHEHLPRGQRQQATIAEGRKKHTAQPAAGAQTRPIDPRICQKGQIFELHLNSALRI